MQILDTVLVALILSGAGFYLYKAVKTKSKSGGDCGCGNLDCKVQKPHLNPCESNQKK